MTEKYRWLIACSSLLSVLSAGAHAQTAISSTFSIAVEADANQLIGGNSQSIFTDSQAGTLNPYSHSLSVTDTESGGGHVTTTSTASASWSSAGSGTVTFRDMGWTLSSLKNHEAKLNSFVTSQDVWTYKFAAAANGQFTMNYNVRGVGATFGLWGVLIHWSGPGGDLNLSNAYNPAAVGTFVRSLTNGSTYTVGLYNFGNIFRAANLSGTTSGHMDADFTWSVGAVPEPASFAMLGLGAVGLIARRRR